MNISGIDTKYQNYAPTGNSGSSNGSVNVFESFQDELVNWEKRVKETLDKQQENDKSGNIQMSEKQWRDLMKKVDCAIDTSNDNIKEQTAKKQADEKNQVQELKIK